MANQESPKSEEILLDLAKADYEATHRALTGFVTSAGQLRAVGIAAWGVVYAAALAAHSVPVALVGLVLVPAFVVADGYYSTLYRQTLARSRDLEALISGYYNALGIHKSEPLARFRAITALEQHDFGVHSAMKPVNSEEGWWWPRPVRLAAVYPVLLLIGLVIVIVLAAGHGASNDCRDGKMGSRPCVVLTTPADPHGQ